MLATGGSSSHRAGRPDSVRPFGRLGELALAKQQQVRGLHSFPDYNDGAAHGVAYGDCREDCTKNVQILAVAAVLFGTITVVQFIAALVANSNALLVDCACMAVDTLSFCGNIYAECRTNRGRRRSGVSIDVSAGVGVGSDDKGGKLGTTDDPASRNGSNDGGFVQLIASGFSLLVLLGVSAWFFAEAIVDIVDPDEAGGEVDPWIVFSFALLGLIFDASSLLAFYCWGSSLLGELDPETLNMGSALMHVLSDSLRSVTTLVESLLIFGFPSVSSNLFDAWATLIVAGLVIVATAPPCGAISVSLVEWISQERRGGGYEQLDAP